MTITHFEGYNCAGELDTERRTVTLNHSGVVTLRAKKKASPWVIAFSDIEAVEHKSGVMGGSLRIVRRDRAGHARTVPNDFNAFQEKAGHPVAEIANAIREAVGLPIEVEPEKSTTKVQITADSPRREPPSTPGTSRPASSRVLAKGAVGSGDYMTIYQDGTFTTGQWNPGRRDRLIGFSYDADSMRRKSVTGRTAAAVVSGGYSLAAANNRGVLYVTVIGLDGGPQTFTTRNPSNVVLSSVRALKAAYDALPSMSPPTPVTPVAASPVDLSGQLAKLAELHDAGALSDSEFADAKRRLLS